MTDIVDPTSVLTEEVCDWAMDAAAEYGGSTRGLALAHARPWSTTWRLDFSPAPPLWLKVDRTGRNTEARVLDVLGGACPGSVPILLASDERLNAILLRDAGVVHEELSFERWRRALRLYAGVQAEVQPHVGALRQARVPDLSPSRLPGEYEEVVVRAVATGVLSDREMEVYLSRTSDIAGWVEELAVDGMPSTIQHDDLHPGNVAESATGMSLLDWADSSIAHPYMTLLYPLQIAERGPLSPSAPADGDRRELFRAYLEGWGKELTAEEYGSLNLACRLAGVGRAVIWQAINELGRNSFVKEYYATGVERWLDRLLA